MTHAEWFILFVSVPELFGVSAVNRLHVGHYSAGAPGILGPARNNVRQAWFPWQLLQGHAEHLVSTGVRCTR